MTAATTEARRRHHERAIEDAHRRDPVPTMGPISTEEWRGRRATRARMYLLWCAGLHLEDLDDDTARYVDRLTRYGDTPEIAGACALVEAARGHVTGGEPVRTPASRVPELHRPRCCDAPDVESVRGLGLDDGAFITVYCSACDTQLLSLDPPAAGNTAPYVGDFRRGVEPTGEWEED